MEKIKVKVDWCDKNYAAVTEDDRLFGMVIVTAKTYSALLGNLRKAVEEHVQEETDYAFPSWLTEGHFDFSIELGTAALLKKSEQYTTLVALARESGISKVLLSHYANGQKKPSIMQRKRICNGLHRIAHALNDIPNE